MSTSTVIEGIRMIDIPAGDFFMGHEYRFDPEQAENVNRYYPDEQPVMKRTVQAFQLGETPVTQSLYEKIAGSENNRSTFRGGELPVTNIGPYEITLFANTLSRKAGLEPCYDENAKRGSGRYLRADFSKNGFRLPGEAEWEYSCRAGGASAHFYNGNTEDDLAQAGWYIGNSGGRTHPVGEKEPNGWGIYDMHGNVFEFCDDDWNPNMCYGHYLTGRETDLVFHYYHQMNVTRGGSWFSEPSVCRSAARSCFCNWPKMNGWYNGFRLARSL